MLFHLNEFIKKETDYKREIYSVVLSRTSITQLSISLEFYQITAMILRKISSHKASLTNYTTEHSAMDI